MQTMTPVSELVAQAKMHAERNAAYLLHTFSFVPDDKLHWAPSATAKSALRILAHCAVSNEGISHSIRQEAPPEGVGMEQIMQMMTEAETAITTREQGVQALKDSMSTVLSSIDTVTTEGLNSNPGSPFGAFPMMFWMFLPGNHMGGHAYQIDYIQTVYGDLEFHFPEM